MDEVSAQTPASQPAPLVVPQVTPQVVPIQAAPPAPQAICPQCHQPVRPEYYFCPNCGKKLSEPALSTGVGAQVMLYAFSIVLPIMCFLAVSYWQGIKYARSPDPKAQEMGWIAIALLALSTIITFWITSVWISGFIASQTSTAGLSAYGI